MKDLKVRIVIVSPVQGMNWEKTTLIARGLHNHFSKYYEGISFSVSSGNNDGCEITVDLPESIVKDFSRTAKRLAKEYSEVLHPFLTIQNKGK